MFSAIQSLPPTVMPGLVPGISLGQLRCGVEAGALT